MTTTERPSLAGARIGRIDMPTRSLVSLEILGLARSFLLVSFSRDAPGVGIVEARPRGLPATGHVRRLRLAFEGATIVSTTIGRQGVDLLTARGDVMTRLVARFDAPEVLIVADGARAIAFGLPSRALADRNLEPSAKVPPIDGAPIELESLRTAGDALAARLATRDHERRRTALARLVNRTVDRAARKASAIESDLARVPHATELRRHATAILGSLHAIQKGAVRARVMDWMAEPPLEIDIELDPKIGPRAHAEALFRRARKLDASVPALSERLRATAANRDLLSALHSEIVRAADRATLDALVARTIALRVPGSSELDGDPHDLREPSRKPLPRLPFRRYRASFDREIRVGRRAADNDDLTLHHSKPHDLWLHARGSTGAHIIVPLERGHSCPAELLIDAATLAAHFSQFAGEPVVEIEYVERRHVRKPKGAPRGSVLVERSKTLVLRVEPDRIARLLASEIVT